MADSTLNRFVARGTNAERVAFTPDEPTPASGPDQGYFFYETDTGDTYAWDGAAWDQVNTAAAAIDQLTGDVTAGPGSGSQAATIANDAVTYAKMQDVSATSRLLGRTTAGAGNVEEVVLDPDNTLAADSDIIVPTQKAVKAYVDAAGGGGAAWTLVSSTSPSGVASVDVNGLASYNEILIIARALTASVSGLRSVQVSVDNGSTFYSASGDYIGISSAAVETATTVMANHSTGSTAARTLIAHIINTKGAVKYCHQYNATEILRLFVASASDINAVRVLNAAGGTISGGPVYVFAR